MMKKNLLKTLFALALVLISGNAWGEDYSLYSGDLTEGDYIVYYNGKAMNNTISNNRLGYVEVTPSNNVISTTDASIVWHISSSGTYWTLYNEAVKKYAACTGAANKVQLLSSGTDDKALWTVSGNSTYDFVNKANDVAGVSKNLRNNGSYGFSCYATSTGGALSLYKKVESNAVATTVTIDDTGITNADVYVGTEAGSLSATVAAGATPINNPTITWSSSNSEVATISANGAVTLVAAGVTTITASYEGEKDVYKASSATYELAVTNSNPNRPGAANNPYSVAQARAAIDANGTVDDAYATGIIFQIDSYNSDYKSITYWISDDGTNTNPLEVYGGLAKEGEEFSSIDDLVIGAKVVVKGQLKKYSSTYEFNSDNRLISIIFPVSTPTFSVEAGIYPVQQDVTISCATPGATIHYTLNGNDPSSTSPVYLTALSITETTTLKAIAVMDGYLDSQIATAVYTIAAIVNPTSVSVAPETAEVMVGESTTLIATVLPADATYKEVTWESSDPTVATVSDAGVVTALKEGTTTVTATSVADGTKIGNCTITVIKANYDLLSGAFTGITSGTYSEWARKGSNTGITYKGKTAGTYSSIQLNNSSTGYYGIVTTSFYGRATKIVVEWNSNTQSGRTLDIYGKATAYSAVSDLYDDTKKGTKLGSIVCGTSTEYVFPSTPSYDYIGLLSNKSAMYIDKIKIYWEQKKTNVSVSQYEWATASFSERVVVPTDGTVYKVNGATDGSLNLVEVPEGGVIGKNVGVLLYKAGGGDIEFVITGSDATVKGTDTDNKLLATGGITTADYILGTYDGGFGFCHPSEAMTCTSGKAFLPASAVTGASAPFLRIGGATNMANVESDMEINVYYDLMGRKVEQPERGIYILNGKKVLVK